jgi:starch-binding outer membrane protein, SusD/RagB family
MIKTMKTKFNFKYLLLIPAFVMGSCGEDFVNIPLQDRSDLASFYKSDTEVLNAPDRLYGSAWFPFNDKFWWCAGEVMPGNLKHTWSDEGQFFNFSYTAGNSVNRQGWAGIYSVVTTSNALINDITTFAQPGVTEAAKNVAFSEAKFMRSMAFYFLTEYWDEIPIIEDAAKLLAEDKINVKKNTKSSIYDFIIKDLQFASTNLGNKGLKPGRISKWSAKGMLAKVAVTAAQYHSKTNAAKAAELFALAKKESEEVITQSGLKLLPNYADLFKIQFNNNDESLAAMQFIQGNYWIGNSRQAVFGRSSTITGNTEAWGGGKSMTEDFLSNVTRGDKRLREIYMSAGDVYPEINKAGGGYTYKIVNRDPTGSVLENANDGLNNCKKFIVGSAQDNDGKVTTGQAVALNQPMLRLADVYLVYVEAAIGTGNSTSDAKALEYLNAIRSRAGLPAKTSVTYVELLKERRVEFALESQYWFDVKRYFYKDKDAMIAMMSAQKRGFSYRIKPGGDENKPGDYILQEDGSGGTRPFTATDSKLPIPENEQVFNPNLKPDVPAEDYKF